MKNAKRLINGLVISLFVLMLPGTALASPGGEETTVTVGGYQVSLVFAEPAKLGVNSLHVQILAEMGMPVSEAQVEISAMPVEDTTQHEENMENDEPVMGGMEGMDSPAAPTAVPSNAIPGMHGMESAPVVEETPVDDHPVEAVTPVDGHPVEAVTVMLEPDHESGEYAGEISFPEAGHWMLTVHLSIDGENLEADFPVEVTGGSPSISILAGFASLNAVLIGVAAFTRRKPASA